MPFVHAANKTKVPLPDAMGHQFGVDLFCTHKPCEGYWVTNRDNPEPCWFTKGNEDVPSCIEKTPAATVKEIVSMRTAGKTMDEISEATGVPRSRVSGILEFEMRGE